MVDGINGAPDTAPAAESEDILDELPTLHQVPSLQPAPAHLYGRNGAETISGLCGIGVVHEAGAEEVGEERRGHVAGYRDRCRHDAASVVPMMESDGGAPSPEHPAAAPASGQTLALGGEGRGGGRRQD